MPGSAEVRPTRTDRPDRRPLWPPRGADNASRKATIVTSDIGDTADVAMPAAFIGHGNPMNALEVNRYTTAWKAFGAAVPRPRAILVVSAHWYINATAVTAMPQAADHPRLLRIPAGAVRCAVPRTRATRAGRRGQRRRPPDLGRRRRRQLGHRPRHLVGAGARLPRRLHPGRPAQHQRRQALGLPPASSARSWHRCGSAVCSSSPAATSCTTCAAWTGSSPTTATTGRSASTRTPRPAC